jgi:hypothetical protein
VASNTYYYTVTAVYNSWSATSPASGSVIVPTSQLSSLSLSSSTLTPTSGDAFTVTLTATDQYGNTDTGYNGPENVIFSGPKAALNGSAPSYPTSSPYVIGSSVNFVSGIASGANAASITLFDAQSVTLTATDFGSRTTGTIDLAVGAGSASSFTLANPGGQTAGASFGDTVTALDQNGNTATGYSGSELVVFTGPSNAPNGTAPTYPASVTFTSGVGTPTGITLVNAETTTLTATQGSITGVSNNFTVGAGSASSFTVASPGDQTTDTSFGDTVTALDQYGNTATGYSGSKSVAFTGPANSPNGTAPTYPASVTFNSGVGTPADITLVNAETTTLTATQGSITGVSNSFKVGAGSASSFTVANPGDQTTDTSFGDTISALDQYGNVATGYSGSKSVAFTGPSNSPNGTAPTYPVLVSFASGTGTAAGITLVNAETTALTVTQGSITGVSNNFKVGAGSASSFTVENPGNQMAGTPFRTTVTAFDQYGNVATGYSGSKSVAFTGPSNSPNSTAPTYPASVIFTSGAGMAAGITLVNTETTTLTATQGSITGVSNNFKVGADSASSYTVANPGNQMAGTPFRTTVTALDQYGNTATGYSGSQSVAFTGPSNSPNGTAPTYPSTVIFTSGTGTAAGITLVSAETTAVTATQGSITGVSNNFTVGAGSANSFTVANPGDQTAGTPFRTIVTALDQYGNTAPGYSGDQTIVFSGPAASPNGSVPSYPASVTFTSGVGTPAGITLVNAETTALTATQGSITGSSASFTVVPSPIVAGIALADITTNATPTVSCTGPIGSVSCSSTGEGIGGPLATTLAALLQIEDQYGNVVTNTGSSIAIDLTTSGNGSVTPNGTDVLSILTGSSTTSTSFTLAFDNENSNTVAMTATVDGQGQTLIITLSN